MFKSDDGESFRMHLHKQLYRTTLIDRAIDQCAVIVWATDLEGEILLCDGGGLRDLGVSTDSIGKNIMDQCCYPTRWQQAVEVVRSSGRASFTIAIDHGSVVESFGPLLSPAGRVVGVLAVSTVLGE